MSSKTISENILVVENNQDDLDLIVNQAIKPLGYRVSMADSVSSALQLVTGVVPDIVLSSLHLPDLSGRDLLVALQSQNIHAPLILMAEQGFEHEVLQAFRLGAADYICKPLREAEVLATTERAMKAVRARKESELQISKLEENNQALENHIGELNTIFSIGKAVAATTHPGEQYKILIDGAVRATGADRGYLLIRDQTNRLILSATHNLPEPFNTTLNHELEDGLSSKAVMTGKSLQVHGEELTDYAHKELGKAVMIVPITAQNETTGIFVVIRNNDDPFSSLALDTLCSVADYAALALASARYIHILENRIQKLHAAAQAGGRT